MILRVLAPALSHRPDAGPRPPRGHRGPGPLAARRRDRQRPHRAAPADGAGTVIVLAGLAVGGGHLLSVTRQWVNEMEVPPSELARAKWAQAKTAVAAGAQTWQNGS